MRRVFNKELQSKENTCLIFHKVAQATFWHVDHVIHVILHQTTHDAACHCHGTSFIIVIISNEETEETATLYRNDCSIEGQLWHPNAKRMRHSIAAF